MIVKNGITINLFSHLKHRDPKEYSELKLNKDPRQCHQNDQFGSSSSQPTVKQAFINTQEYSKSSKHWQQLTANALQKIC